MPKATVEPLFPTVQRLAAPAPASGLAPRAARLDAWFTRRLLIAADWAIALAVAAACAQLGLGLGLLHLPLGAAIAPFACGLALKLGLWAVGAYTVDRLDQQRADRALGGVALGTLGLLVVLAAAAPSQAFFIVASATVPTGALFIAGLHAGVTFLFRGAARAGLLADTAVIVGATEAAERLIKRNADTGDLTIVGVFDDRHDRAPDTLQGVPVLGSLEDLLAWPSLPDIDRIVVCVSQRAEARVRALIERLRIAPNRIDLVLDFEGLAPGAGPVQLDRLADIPAARVSGGGVDRRRAIAKRVQDLLIGAPLMLAFLPLMGVIAILVRLDSPGPALFRQRREGYNNKIITVYKFRTMRHDPDGGARPVQQVRPGDPRVTRLGQFLRRTSLDELPQLFNVLKGDMSLVGPRPHAVGMRTGGVETASIIREYAHRHRIKPGLTGWAQINGSRGPVETPEALRERLRYDLEYIARMSTWFDLWVLARTAPALLGDELCTR